MTLEMIAFGAPFVMLAFMLALAYGVSWYNRAPARPVAKSAGKYEKHVASVVVRARPKVAVPKKRVAVGH